MITSKTIIKFEKVIEYQFKNKELLKSSLIHPSYVKDKKNKKINLYNDFERLEFLGDRVLGLVIASILYKRFKNFNEGDLSKKLSYLVQKNFLYKISNNLYLEKTLKYSSKKENSKLNTSIFADAVEALIGSIYLDGGYKASLKFIDKYWGPYLNIKTSSFQDPKTKLQEISQQKFKKLPEYKLTEKKGPSHSPTFTVTLKALNLNQIKAKGGSIREAEKNAAIIALKNIHEK